MIRKYHNHKLQTNQWHREEEAHNHKQSNQLSFPHQDDCKTRIDITYRTTKHTTIKTPTTGVHNQQRINNN